MTKAAHTPGPWEASDRGDYGDFDGNSRVILGDDMRIAVVHDHGDEDEGNGAANTRLIVAAPETIGELKRLYAAYVRLLEAGRDRIVSLGGTCDAVEVMEKNDPALVSCRATIAKAT